MVIRLGLLGAVLVVLSLLHVFGMEIWGTVLGAVMVGSAAVAWFRQHSASTSGNGGDER